MQEYFKELSLNELVCFVAPIASQYPNVKMVSDSNGIVFMCDERVERVQRCNKFSILLALNAAVGHHDFGNSIIGSFDSDGVGELSKVTRKIKDRTKYYDYKTEFMYLYFITDEKGLFKIGITQSYKGPTTKRFKTMKDFTKILHVFKGKNLDIRKVEKEIKNNTIFKADLYKGTRQGHTETFTKDISITKEFEAITEKLEKVDENVNIRRHNYPHRISQ